MTGRSEAAQVNASLLVVGLTGSIGMGKSTVAGWMRARGLPVSDSDQVVHDLYSGDAVALIEDAFPGVTVDGVVDRQKLSAELVADAGGFERLEAIVHPLVRDAQAEFLRACAARGEPVAVLEIPLLFETQGDAKVDIVVVADAGADEQRRRVLARPGMSEEKLATILSRQVSPEEKARRADFVVDTSVTLAESEAQVATLVDAFRVRKGTAFARLWREEA